MDEKHSGIFIPQNADQGGSCKEKAALRESLWHPHQSRFRPHQYRRMTRLTREFLPNYPDIPMRRKIVASQRRFDMDTP